MKPQGVLFLLKNVIALLINHLGKIVSFQCGKRAVKLGIIKLIFFINVTALVWMYWLQNTN